MLKTEFNTVSDMKGGPGRLDWGGRVSDGRLCLRNRTRLREGLLGGSVIGDAVLSEKAGLELEPQPDSITTRNTVGTEGSQLEPEGSQLEPSLSFAASPKPHASPLSQQQASLRLFWGVLWRRHGTAAPLLLAVTPPVSEDVFSPNKGFISHRYTHFSN